MRKVLALCFLLMFGLMVSGCKTMKGACDGAKEDWQDSCKGVKGADNWMKKNLW